MNELVPQVTPIAKGFLVAGVGHGVPTADGWVGIYDGEGPFLEAQIEAVARLAEKASAVRGFTGGTTRWQHTLETEADTYEAFARKQGWLSDMEDKTLVEPFARCSLENIVFLLGAYFKAYGAYPAKLTVVGWKFKEPRFRLHAAAVGAWLFAKGVTLPGDWFDYRASNPPPANYDAAVRDERAKLIDVLTDPFLQAQKYQALRASRTPPQRLSTYEQEHGYYAAVPDLPRI